MNPFADRKGRSPIDLLGTNNPEFTPRPFVGSKEFRKMVLFTIFALGIAAFFFGRMMDPAGPHQAVPTDRDPRLPAGGQVLEPEKIDILDFEGKDTVEPFTQEVKKDQPYLSALGAMSKVPAADLSRRVDAGVNVPTLVKFPEKCRGGFVKVRGLLLEMWPFPEKLPTNPAGLQDVYIAFLLDWETDDVVAVHFLEKPDFSPSVKEDLMRVEGVFYQVLSYKSKTNQDRQAPVILAQRVVKLPPMKFEQRSDFAWTVAGITGIIVSLILAAGYYNRKKEREFEQRMKGVKIKKTRDAAPAAGAPASAAPAAPTAPARAAPAAPAAPATPAEPAPPASAGPLAVAPAPPAPPPSQDPPVPSGNP